MDPARAQAPPRWSGWPIPVAVAVCLVALAVVTVVIAQQSGGSGAPPAARAFVSPPPARPFKALDVELASDGRLRVTDGATRSGAQGATELAVPPSAAVDILEPATVADIHPGDRLTVIGIANEVRNAAVRMFLILPAGNVQDGEAPRGAAGFAGNESSRDPKDLPLFWGTVDSVSGTTVMLRSGAGGASVDLSPAAPLRRLRPAIPGEIRSGDRIAVHLDPGGSLNLAAGVLVLAAGAR